MGTPTRGAVHATFRAGPPRETTGDRVRQRLEDLPLRVRLVAVLLTLLLAALTLTAGATAALMRRDLMGRIDADLRIAAAPIARQALSAVIRGSSNARLPSNYAFVLVPTDGEDPITVRPSTADVLPSVGPLPLADSRVRTGKPFTIGSVA